ncbi:hypothetical membrane protein [Pelotomaculum thermopropionicum SI]|uniref:Hypothetical membrane protein n=1 Tax=Pelotomaculum thermopropionicum (strain DSM 13744 / JCM 10971 / SI) TaxID=370438 RepID=A5CZD3_PELTS|nr:hypothetical membrane protein [Pelotomaculum thermopropionicum SI]
MKTAERNFRCGVYTSDLAAPALANRVAAGSSALVVGSFGAEYYQFALETRGIKVMVIPEVPGDVDMILALAVLKSRREGFISVPCAVFTFKWRVIPNNIKRILLECADVIAVLLPVWGKGDIPAGIANAEELLALSEKWFSVHYDPDIEPPASGWAAGLSFTPAQVWTPDGPMWT